MIGGTFPYTFALSGQPAGMTVANASDVAGGVCGLASTGQTHVDCGKITWKNPQRFG